MQRLDSSTLAKLAVAYSGLVWGLFWMPLRALEKTGIDALWSLALFCFVPAILVSPLALWRWRAMRESGLIVIGLATAVPLVLYSLAVLNTNVIRAMMLFYLSPVWSTLLERAVMKQPITGLRWMGIAIAFAGMLVIFHGESWLPIPQNGGDWAALAAGFGWSVSTVLLRLGQHHRAVDLMLQNFLWSGLAMIVVILVVGGHAAPTLQLALDQLWWLVPVVLTVVVSGVYTSMWGAPKLSPGVAGLLYMTEISAGTITAAIWAGEPFGWREILGVILISAAGVLESAVESLRPRQA
jgi:drug/metabolite transporter (DMT)-like permease